MTSAVHLNGRFLLRDGSCDSALFTVLSFESSFRTAARGVREQWDFSDEDQILRYHPLLPSNSAAFHGAFTRPLERGVFCGPVSHFENLCDGQCDASSRTVAPGISVARNI